MTEQNMYNDMVVEGTYLKGKLKISGAKDLILAGETEGMIDGKFYHCEGDLKGENTLFVNYFRQIEGGR